VCSSIETGIAVVPYRNEEHAVRVASRKSIQTIGYLCLMELSIR
jgi:hypothetical protein